MKPLVSVIITSYNYARYVGKAIESALSQTHENLEILVLDNASTDGSPDVIAQYTDTRVRFIRNESNIGLWPNQNKGLSLASGDYVLFLSADDYLLPTHVADTLAFACEHPNADVVYSPYLMIDEDGKVIGRFDHPGFRGLERYSGRNELASLLTEDSYMCFPTALFPRRFFEDYGMLDESFAVGADYEFFIRLAFQGVRFAFRATPSVCVRVHAKNLSGPQKYVKSGQQVREYSTILTRYVVSDAFDALIGYRHALARMIQNKLADLERSFPQDYAALRSQLEPVASAVLAQVCEVPETGSQAQPFISVIVPASGDLRCLVEAIESIAEQTFDRWEIVIVVDGAFDPSPYLSAMPCASKIRVARTIGRRGAAFSRNAGIHLSRGDVIAYLDDDNRFLPGYFDALAERFADPAVRVTVAPAKLSLFGTAAGHFRAGTPSLIAPDIALNAVAHRRCCVDEMQYFNESFEVLEEWEFLLRYARRFTFTCLEQPAVEVRIREEVQRHELFGRRDRTRWSVFANALNSIYSGYGSPNVDVQSAREQYARELNGAINCVVSSQNAENVSRIVQVITAARAEGAFSA